MPKKAPAADPLTEEQCAGVVLRLQAGLAFEAPEDSDPQWASITFAEPNFVIGEGGEPLLEEEFVAALIAVESGETIEALAAFSAQPLKTKPDHPVAECAQVSVGDSVDYWCLTGQWLSGWVSHIETPAEMIVVKYTIGEREAKPPPELTEAFLDLAQTESQIVPGDAVSVPWNVLEFSAAGSAVPSRDATGGRKISGEPMLRICATALKGSAPSGFQVQRPCAPPPHPSLFGIGPRRQLKFVILLSSSPQSTSRSTAHVSAGARTACGWPPQFRYSRGVSVQVPCARLNRNDTSCLRGGLFRHRLRKSEPLGHWIQA